MPSGLSIDTDRLEELLKVSPISLVETKSGKTIAVIYFNQMPANKDICFKVHGYKSHKVAENKSIAVQIYDYYDSCEYSSHFCIKISSNLSKCS